MSGSGPVAALLPLAFVAVARAAVPAGIPPPILDLDTLCTELGSWQAKLSDRTLGPAGRASATSAAWILPLGERLGLGIPRTTVLEVVLEATGGRLDTVVLRLAGERPRLLMLSPAGAERLATRWFEGGPTYYELLGEAMARHGERRACAIDEGAQVRAALGEMTAATFLRVGGEGEVFLRDAATGYLVRERTRFDDGTAQLDWNAVLVAGPGPDYLLAQWQLPDDDVLAMAPAATGPREAEAPEGQPDWVAGLGAALARRDVAALVALAGRQGWDCRLRQGELASQPCATAPAPPAR